MSRIGVDSSGRVRVNCSTRRVTPCCGDPPDVPGITYVRCSDGSIATGPAPTPGLPGFGLFGSVFPTVRVGDACYTATNIDPNLFPLAPVIVPRAVVSGCQACQCADCIGITYQPKLFEQEPGGAWFVADDGSPRNISVCAAVDSAEAEVTSVRRQVIVDVRNDRVITGVERRYQRVTYTGGANVTERVRIVNERLVERPGQPDDVTVTVVQDTTLQRPFIGPAALANLEFYSHLAETGLNELTGTGAGNAGILQYIRSLADLHNFSTADDTTFSATVAGFGSGNPYGGSFSAQAMYQSIFTNGGSQTNTINATGGYSWVPRGSCSSYTPFANFRPRVYADSCDGSARITVPLAVAQDAAAPVVLRREGVLYELTGEASTGPSVEAEVFEGSCLTGITGGSPLPPPPPPGAPIAGSNFECRGCGG